MVYGPTGSNGARKSPCASVIDSRVDAGGVVRDDDGDTWHDRAGGIDHDTVNRSGRRLRRKTHRDKEQGNNSQRTGDAWREMGEHVTSRREGRGSGRRCQRRAVRVHFAIR